ncbi:MAG: hypothetical protein AAF889_04220 [Cyanobacteria bacterium P01_D01_bin.73]
MKWLLVRYEVSKAYFETSSFLGGKALNLDFTKAWLFTLDKVKESA